jgi:hypothetical protein
MLNDRDPISERGGEEEDALLAENSPGAEI